MKEIKGLKFEKLTAINFYRNHHFPSGVIHEEWLFKCDCGKSKVIDKHRVVGGYTKSCGCLNVESARNMGKKCFKHGISNNHFYKKWVGMKERCYKKEKHKNYGSRGIIVCDYWLNSFLNFKKEMFSSYLCHVKEFGKENTTLDRINNDGNYCKENCRWATIKEQTNNRRNTFYITFNGITKSVSEWAESLGVSRSLLYDRIKRQGWSNEKALTKKNYR